MKDDKGIFYYPFPQNRRVRMYVRQSGGTLEFRMWNADDPVLWGKRGVFFPQYGLFDFAGGVAGD